MQTNRTQLLGLVLVSLFAGSASAQTVFFEENFEGAFPGGATTSGTSPSLWHQASPTECGVLSSMAAWSRPEPFCDHVTGAMPGYGELSVPPTLMTVEGPYVVEFDYILDIDSEDRFRLEVSSPQIAFFVPYIIATEFELIGDGVLHTAFIEVPDTTLFLGNQMAVHFRIETNGIGETGAGLKLDNIRVRDGGGAYTYCAATTSAFPCPCGNVATAHTGCLQFSGLGARLVGSGSNSVTTDTFALTGRDLAPGQFGLFYMGANIVGFPFGDGIRCVGGGMGSIYRFPIQIISSSGSMTLNQVVGFTQANFPAAGKIQPGQQWNFQAWFRDPGGPCNSGFNLSNGYGMVFGI